MDQLPPNTDSATFLFNLILQQINQLDKRTETAFNAIDKKLAEMQGAVTSRLDTVEHWRIAHESGRGHPDITGQLEIIVKRIDTTDQTVKEIKTAADLTKKQDEDRDKARSKREARFYAVVTILLTFGIMLSGFLTIIHPFGH